MCIFWNNPQKIERKKKKKGKKTTQKRQRERERGKEEHFSTVQINFRSVYTGGPETCGVADCAILSRFLEKKKKKKKKFPRMSLLEIED